MNDRALVRAYCAYARAALRLIVAHVVVACAYLSTGSVSVAQSASRTVETYSGVFVGVPLEAALSRVLDETRIPIAFESDLVRGPVTYCKAVDLTSDELLSCILAGTGLDFIRLSSGTYVIVEESRVAGRIGSVVGRIVDGETLAPLVDANVIVTGVHTGASTNFDGRFAIAGLQAGRHRLIVTHVAYHSVERDVVVDAGARTNLDLQLAPKVVSNDPIVINGFEHRLPIDALGTASPTPGNDLAPDVGTPDLIQDLGAVAGVHLDRGTADVHVQGGGSGEQQFRLDGIPVFIPVANAGYFGPFSPHAIGQVTVRKAGFGAAHGSGLSGVIELAHRIESADRSSGNFTVDPMSANLRLSGRWSSGPGKRVEWMVAGRKALWDVFGSGRLRTLFRDWGAADAFLSESLGVTEQGTRIQPVLPGDVEFDFNALHGAIRVHLGGFQSVSVSLFRGANSFGLEGVTLASNDTVFTFTDTYEWANRAAQVRYEWVASSRLLLAIATWNARYELSRPTLSAYRDSLFIEDFNELDQIGLRVEMQLAVTSAHSVSASVDLSHTKSDFAFSLDPLGETLAVADDVQPVRELAAGHVEDRISLSGSTTLSVGSRFTYLPARKQVFSEPRIELRTDLATGAGAVALRVAAGRYLQYMNSFDVTTSGIATLLPVLRYWLPVGRGQAIPRAYHLTVGALYRPDDRWQAGVESFLKRQQHLLVPDYRRDSSVDGVLTEAEGYAHGVSAFVVRASSGLRLETRYELEVARRRIPDRFGGRHNPVPWEAPHRIVVAAFASPVRMLTVSLRWQGWYGRSWAYRRSYYDYLEPDPATRTVGSIDLSAPQRHALPAFSQVDVGAQVGFAVGNIDVDIRASISNLLGRSNVNEWGLSGVSGDEPDRTTRLSTPFLPSVSISAAW